MKRTFFFFVVAIAICSHVGAQVPTMKGNWQWVKSIGSVNQTGGSTARGDEMINMMKTDGQGNTYICGKVYGFANVQGLNVTGNAYSQINNSRQNNSNLQGFLAKYDCDGNLLWFKELGDSLYTSSINDFVVDSVGNIYCAGTCSWGWVNTYWGDTLCMPSVSTVAAASIVMKVDKNGRFIWATSANDIFGINTLSNYNDIGIGVQANFHYFNTHSSSIYLKGDTLIGLGGTVHGYNYTSAQVVRYNTVTGQLIDTLKLWDSNSGFGIDNGTAPSSFGIDNAGNYYMTLNLATPQNIFMNLQINTPNANSGYDNGALIKFNRNQVLGINIFKDTTHAIIANFDDVDKGIQVIANTKQGQSIVPQYTTKPYSGGQALLNFGVINKLKWGLEPDSSTNGGIFMFAKPVVVNDKYIYVVSAGQDFVRFGKDTIHTSQPNYQRYSKVFTISMDSGKLIEQSKDLNTVNGNIYGDYSMINSISVNEKGELNSTGYFAHNRIIAGQDTTTFFGGNNDMFTIKYGYPCSSDSALIEPVATTNLHLICKDADSVLLTWNDNSNIEWGYHIYRATGNRNATYTLIDTTAKNVTSYFDNTIAANTNYWYKVAAFNNIGDGVFTNIDSSMGCKATGINALNKNTFAAKIYPNPTQTGEFTLSVQSNETGKAQLQISNYMGQIILDENVQLNNSNQWHLNLSKYSSGTYLVTLKTSSGNFGERVMVVR